MVKNTDFTSLVDLAYNYITGTPTTPESTQRLRDYFTHNPPVYGILSEIMVVNLILKESPFIARNKEIAWYLLHQTMEERCSSYDLDRLSEFFVEYTIPSDDYRPSMVARFSDGDGDWYTSKGGAVLMNADYITSYPL